MNSRGSVAIIVLIIVTLLGGGGYAAVKGGLFSGQTKRAAESTETTKELLAAQSAKSAKAGAVFSKMGEVVGTLPATREKDFLARSVGIGLSFTDAPDPTFELEMEKLRNAVLTGQVKQANEINAELSKTAAEDRARAERAIAAKARIDLALEQAAAEERGQESEKFIFMALAAAALVLYVWTKFSHVSPLALSGIVTDIREGKTEADKAIAAINTATTPFQQLNTRLMVWARSKFAKVTS